MSMKSSARAGAKAKARRLTKVTTGKVDASGWTQPHEARTPRMRRAYAAGGKCVGEVDKDDMKAAPRGDKRPRKMDGGPMTGPNDPRQIADSMMQSAAARAPVSGSNPIPTYSSPSQKKSPLRMGFEKGGGIKGPPKSVNNVMHPSVKKTVAVPKRIPIAGRDAVMPNTEYGPEAASKLKKGGRVGKGFGGALGLIPELVSGMGGGDDKKPTPITPGAKKGGRIAKAGGGRVKGKTNINIIIAPGGGGGDAPPAAPPMMGAPGMMPHPPAPPMPPAGGPPGAPPPAAAPNPLAGMPPQALAAMLGGGGGGASMPPAGPPRLPMRANGGRIMRDTMRDGAGGGLGRIEKADQVRAMKKQGNHGL